MSIGRACGFTVVAAGKGTRHEPHYHSSTPDTPGDLDKYLQITDRASINPKMFQQFHRWHEIRIEMTAVQCDRPRPQAAGFGFAGDRFELADI
jgi:predicted homoserine dehydrogenase-like protein